MFGPKQIEPAGLRPNSASAFFGLGAALDPAGDPAGHCFFTRRRAWTAYKNIVIKMQRGGKTQGGLAGWCYFLLLCFPLVLPLVFFLSALFLCFMGSFLFSNLSLSLLCLLCFFFCHLCLFLIFPWFLGSLSVFSNLLCSMCVSSSLVFVFLFLCVRSLPGSLIFFYLSVFSPVLCPPIPSLFLFFFVPLSSGFLPVLPLCFLEFPLFASSPSVFSSVPSVLSPTPCGFSLAYIKP